MGMQVGGSGLKNDINVVPLIDITLVLLIIFMVMTPMAQRGYDMNIPEKAAATVEPPPVQTEQLVLDMTIDGRIQLNKQDVAKEQLTTKIEDLLRGRPQKIVFFNAHTDLFYREVIEVMDIVRAAGGQIGIVTTELQ